MLTRRRTNIDGAREAEEKQPRFGGGKESFRRVLLAASASCNYSPLKCNQNENKGEMIFCYVEMSVCKLLKRTRTCSLEVQGDCFPSGQRSLLQFSF